LKESNRIAEKVVAEVIILGLFLLFFLFGPFYSNFLHKYTKYALLGLYVFYILIFLPISVSKNKRTYFQLFEAGKFLFHWIRSVFGFRKEGIIEEGKHEFLSFLVKIYFIPIMLHYSAWMVKLIKNNGFYQNLSFDYFFSDFNWFFTVVQIIFLIDLSIFTFAYIFESSSLRNKIKSVDKTFLGWFSAIICYHPASLLMLLFFTPTTDKFYFVNDIYTSIIYIFVLLFYILDFTATISLGTKAGNLVNRGIVTSGPYKVIRHPSYLVKIAVMWALTIPVFNTVMIVSSLAWTLIYLLRIVTEEKHLSKDKEYIEYRNKTKYRLIPYVY
jgi:protein-S-isoprenylcysteine O-methyltransferase Ste14